MNETAVGTTVQIKSRWRPYPDSKDSGIEWLGEIPIGWDVTPIRRLAQPGYRSFIDGDWIESPYITNEGVRLIQTGNIGVGYYKEQGFRYVSEETFASLKCTEVMPGDVLICRLADPVGRACQAPTLGVRMITSVDVCILKTVPNVDARFVVYYLSSETYLSWLQANCRGSTRDRVSRSMLGAIQIIAPPLSEQRAIANFLDHETAQIDALIAKKERLIELLTEKRTALISHTVTKGLDPTVPMKDSGVEWIGEIPAHWEVKRNKTLFSLFSGFAFKGEYFSRDDQDAPILVTPGNFDPNGGMYFTESNTVHYTGEYPNNFDLKIGDHLIVMTDLSYKKLILGKCILVERGELLLNQRVAKLVFNPSSEKVLDRKFIAHTLNSTPVREQVLQTARGATVFHSSPSKIGDCFLCLPPLSEQQVIVNHIDLETIKINALINKVCEHIDKLKEYRTAIISAAVTGKIDVREEVTNGHLRT